ncbi:site-specific DNA-methyltransferase [Candidatus Pacearchaeota archaeon]|jgi:site-specific DNA-methyltransferase (adenine-specific)|nr:site-specific DNA-methyltransferase [Candidatus Pacearchaeota archaeon]
MLNLNTIHQGDCLELMQRLESGSVDLIITDPPYLMNYRSNRRVVKEKFNHIENDTNQQFIKDYIKECYRILKQDSAFYCFCSWHKIDIFKQEVEKYFNLKNIIVWNKNNHGSGDLNGSYAPKHEFILFAHKGRALNKQKRIPDVIDCAKINSDKLTHPTEKPIDLLKIFILNNSEEDTIVFDGCAGTGSLALACLNLNRNFIGIEKEEKYVKVAQQRIKEVAGCKAEGDDGIPPTNKLVGILPKIL